MELRTWGKELHRYKALLDKISDDHNDRVRRNLARDNFVRMMMDLGELRVAKMASEKVIRGDASQSTGLVLKPDYEYDEKAHTGARIHSFLEANRLAIDLERHLPAPL